MNRVFEDRAYEAASLNGCFWADSYPREDLVWPSAQGSTSTDVAIIGAGYTGLSAALHLAQNGRSVAVLDMHEPGWGASGRSGGFCCKGGAKASDNFIAKRYGEAALAEWDKVQEESVHLVRSLIDAHGIKADTHSNGETQLAHSAKSYARLEASKLDKGAEFIPTDQLVENGMNASGLYGGKTDPVGFGLHPRKYVLGLAEVAKKAGAKIYGHSEVRKIHRSGQGFELEKLGATVNAGKLIIATNGYSSDSVPSWLKGRFMPVQSNIIVTREMTDAELDAQGWTTRQMVYDTRHMLHYFRLLPDNRMMFGMRGGLSARPSMDRTMHRMIRRDFEAMFPAWAQVETPWFWTGLVCMTGKLTPFVGEIPDMPGAFAGFGWHGNGIAMGSYSGRMLASMALGNEVAIPSVMKGPPPRFPFGRRRRVILPPIYKGLEVKDRLS